nr:hypothetical protein [Tanacetum cinerariifolium]
MGSVPQPSGSTKHVADEAVYKELDDRLVRAVTIAFSLEAEQDGGNIDKTQFKATLNEASSPRTTLGSGPRCQDTMGDTIAQTRFENVSKLSNDSLFARAREITSLKRRVKKLEKKQRSRTYKLKRLYKVGLTARVNVAGEVNAASIATTDSAVATITTNDITLAQALMEIKISKPKAKGVVLQEPRRAKSDLLLNNICKVFNGKIVGGGDNVEGTGSASMQEQQIELVVGQDGSSGSGATVVIGLFVAAGEGGAGDPGGASVSSQGLSHTRWIRRRVQTERISPQKRTPTQPASQPSTSSEVPVSQTRNADEREMGDGVSTQSSAAGGDLGGGGYLRDYVRIVAGTNDRDSDSDLLIPTLWSDESKNEKGQKDMPSEAVEQEMDATVPDEIDGANVKQVSNHVLKKGNFEFLVCKEVANPGVNELVDKGRPLKRKRVYDE